MNIVRFPQHPHKGGGLKNAQCPKRYEIGCQLLLITNRKSHVGASIDTDLDDLE